MHDPERARRFRDAALPHLDEVYTLARYLLRNAADAEDAVQECYLRALSHFDTFRGGPIKPWLFAILRNVCRAELTRSASSAAKPGHRPRCGAVVGRSAGDAGGADLRRRDEQSIRELVGALPDPFRETIVLREINDLSYREIAEVVGAPIGTVMSRLARARAMLRAAWLAVEKKAR